MNHVAYDPDGQLNYYPSDEPIQVVCKGCFKLVNETETTNDNGKVFCEGCMPKESIN